MFGLPSTLCSVCPPPRNLIPDVSEAFEHDWTSPARCRSAPAKPPSVHLLGKRTDHGTSICHTTAAPNAGVAGSAINCYRLPCSQKALPSTGVDVLGGRRCGSNWDLGEWILEIKVAVRPALPTSIELLPLAEVQF
jgi:hypothetical protein